MAGCTRLYNSGVSRAHTHARARTHTCAPTNSMYPKTPMTPVAPLKPPRTSTGRRIQVRRSSVHGRGVFAVAPIEAGELIIEYTGEVIDWPEALRRHPHDPQDPNHTFYFSLESGHVIDAKHGGNSSRWINHACEPNCIADEVDGLLEPAYDQRPAERLAPRGGGLRRPSEACVDLLEVLAHVADIGDELERQGALGGASHQPSCLRAALSTASMSASPRCALKNSGSDSAR